MLKAETDWLELRTVTYYLLLWLNSAGTDWFQWTFHWKINAQTEFFQPRFHWMLNVGTDFFQPKIPPAKNKRCHPDNNIYQADGVAKKTTPDKEPTPEEAGGKTPPTESDKSVSQVLGNSAQILCPMLRPLAGQRAQSIRSLITWVTFFLWRWHIANNVSNNALEPLLKLFCTVLSIAGASEISGVVSQTFPTSIFRLRKWFGMEKADDFQRLVCCDTCYRVYPDDESMRITPPRGQKTGGIRTCYGDIVEGGKVKPCNAILYDCIHKDDGTIEYTPKHIYCYKPLSKSLDAILARPGVLDKCNKWRTREATPREYSDIYDGSVWKRFVRNGFLREQTSLALQLNLDWFQPFTE